MKKYLMIFAAMVMALSMSACSGKSCKDLCDDCGGSKADKKECKAVCDVCEDEGDDYASCLDDNADDVCDEGDIARAALKKCASEAVELGICLASHGYDD